MTNPLVAEAHDSTTWYTGLGLVEDVYQITNGIQNDSWVDDTLGGVGATLDTLSVIVDPFGTLVSWGVSWLMEHVQPLKDALDWLAGNADQVAAHAATWKNVSAYLSEAHQDYDHHVRGDISTWIGASGDAYRREAGTHETVLKAIAVGTAGISYAVQGAGMLVGLVRGIVRDLIAQFVATLAARLPQWLAEEGLTLGIATPAVVGQVSVLVAKWVDRIQGFIRALLNSMRKLSKMLDRLAQSITGLRGSLRKLETAEPAAPSPAASFEHPPASPYEHPLEPASSFEPDSSFEHAPAEPVHTPDPPVPEPVDLSPGDRAAVVDYTTYEGYTEMNGYLRDPQSLSRADGLAVQARADNVSAALAKLPDEPGISYRGTYLNQDLLSRYELGQVVSEHGFTSTSTKGSVAEAFSGNTMMSVAGYSGKNIAPYSPLKEAEVLYDKGTQFRVVHKAWDEGAGRWIINLMEV